MAAFILLQIFVICHTFLVTQSKAEMCEISKNNYCLCKFPNGSYINLHDEESTSHPRSFDFSFFENVINEARYSYDPCAPFKEGTKSGEDDCQSDDVTICRKDNSGSYLNIGDLKTATFVSNGTHWHVSYKHKNSYTNVSLVCVEDGSPTGLAGKGKVTSNTTSGYSLEFHSKCSCVDGCRLPHEGGHSTAFYFFLFLFLGVAIYFMGGMLYLKLSKGAVGREMIPHYEFWASIPNRIQALWTYVRNGCRSEPDSGGYDRI